MYYTHGFYPQELGDIDVIEHDGVLHLFHLTLPTQDIVSHATSTDGLSWSPAPIALRTGDPGDCDDDMIWTMHTVRKPDGSGFNMYYTGCCLREHGHVQRVALAESPDLRAWAKHPANPILESRNPYYNEDFNLVGFISFRDPFVFIEDGLWHMLVVARETSGNRFRRGCVAHATSRDGVSWTLQPPLYAPQSTEDIEVPTILKIEGRYYLFYNVLSVGHTPYRMADSLEGPWVAPERDVMLPAPNSAMRFCHWNGKILAYHWLRAAADWHKRAGAEYSAMVAPKEVEVQPDGTLRLAPFSGWEAYYRGSSQLLTAADFTERNGPSAPWQQTLNGSLSANVNGLATARAATIFDDCIIECELRLDAGHICSLVLRSDAAFEIFNLVQLDYRSSTVELHRYSIYDSSVNRFKVKQPTLIQSASAPLQRGKTVKLRVVACREYVEVCLDGAVHLSAATYKAKSGQVGLWVEEGSAAFSPLSVQPLNQPKEHGY